VLTERRRARLPRAVLAATAAAACTFSRDVRVLPHRLEVSLPPDAVTALNAGDQLDRGLVPEVLAFLGAGGAHSLPPDRALELLGRARLESGDFAGAEAALTRLVERETRPATRAAALWMLSQAAYWRDDFAGAARYAQETREAGRPVPEGWIAFLRSGGSRSLYAGAAPGDRTPPIPLRLGTPNLPRVRVRVNGRSAGELILDSGAALSLLTESVAKRLGVEPVAEAITAFRGLHEAEVSLRLGWARSVSVGGLTLRDVPFGILPDGTLTFESAGPVPFAPPGVLGAHLMKEFDWRFEFGEGRAQAIRIGPASIRGGPGQNVFFRRMKPMLRVSVNGRPWSLFLLDTGSEATMVTPTGLEANRIGGAEPSAPINLEGIGQGRVSWSKISDVRLGAGTWMVWFRDLVVNEGGTGVGDGIVGMSFLTLFDVELRFSSMTLGLERARSRRGRASEAPLPPESGVEPRS
jgi:predicted aspartyl protease